MREINEKFPHLTIINRENSTKVKLIIVGRKKKIRLRSFIINNMSSTALISCMKIDLYLLICHRLNPFILQTMSFVNSACHNWIDKGEFTLWVILYQCNFSSSDQLDISLVQYDTHLFLVIVVLGLKFSLLLTRLPNFSAIFTLWWDPRASKKTCALIGYQRVQNVFPFDSLVDSPKKDKKKCL